MDLFQALAEPTRRNIVELLAQNGQLSATDIYDKFSVSHSAISQHLKVLKEADLVKVEKKAQRRIYQLNPKKVEELEVWVQKLGKMWDARFDRLDRVLAVEKTRLRQGYGGQAEKRKLKIHGR